MAYKQTLRLLTIVAFLSGAGALNAGAADEYLQTVFYSSSEQPIWRPVNAEAEVAAETTGDAAIGDEDGAACGSGCGSCCGSRCDGCCSGGCCKPRLFGLFAPSDGFVDFISPMTNPVYFESPRTLTEARFIYIRHQVPIGAGGGTINLFALQLRAALSDRLSIIATKDGYLTSSNALISDGWANINAGLKYNLFADYERGALLSAAATYQMPTGSSRAFQANGDGIFTMLLTGGLSSPSQLAHWISTSGFILPSNFTENSQLWYWSNHFDRRLGERPIYFLTEFNWYHYMGSGQGGIPGVEGGDLFNFGSSGVAGQDIVTGALGLKYKRTDNFEAGVCWEGPLTKRRDVIDNRLTVDFIFRY